MKVGTVLRMVKRTMVSMPLVPRSMMRDRPPVRRSRWKRSDRLVHVHEGPVGELAHGMLADAGKQRVAQLVEAVLQDARAVIGQHQHDRAEKEGRQQADGVRRVVQRIRRPFEEIGHEQQHDLGRPAGRADAQTTRIFRSGRSEGHI